MLSWLSEIYHTFIEVLLKFLPASPFQGFIQSLSGLPYLGYLNWFIPVADLVAIGTVWLSAIVIFYVVSIVMRWVKMIGG